MRKYLLGTVLLTAIAFAGGYSLGREGYVAEGQVPWEVKVVQRQAPEVVETTLDMGLFWQTLDELEERYLDKEKLEGENLLHGAISGMVSSLKDPYTAFYTPEQNVAFQEGLEGIYEGIGAQLGFKEEQLVIVSPLKDSPTEKAGVKPGDAILAVDGEPTRGWSLPQAVNKIRGEEGTSVTLTLARLGDEERFLDSPLPESEASKKRSSSAAFDISITRQRIKIPSVQLEWVGNAGDIAHVKVLRFGPDTNQEWDSQVLNVKGQMLKGTVEGVILDVRNNPGGFLDAAIYLASEFFADGVVVKRELASGKIEEFKVDHACRLCDGQQVVVLVNGGSASASEIVAGALKARGRAQLVGEKTFGKGTVQEAVELSEGASLHVTTARWLLPDGSSIDGEGIGPDVEVQVDSSADSQAEDVQLEEAIELLNSK